MLVPIRYSDSTLELLDQRVLPHEVRWIRCANAQDAATAIRDMVVRGAPAIAITAAYGLAMEAHRGGDLDEARRVLMAARPTAVNLRWALERMASVSRGQLEAEAIEIHAEDLRINQALGAAGAQLFGDRPVFYTHCNTGALATGGWGTALGVIRSAHAQGTKPRVFVGETRPYLQGARLTAWELQQEGIEATLVVDSVAASVMDQVDAVLVGVDRVANNGDAANKIGTLGLAILARHYGVPFYVCLPTSTLDRRCPNGASIPIEERSPDEVYGYRDTRWAAEIPVFNPAFDVTPADLITGWITEYGVWRTPFPAQPSAETPMVGVTHVLG
jgi:methylthioribose-1-phosphate isomerase